MSETKIKIDDKNASIDPPPDSNKLTAKSDVEAGEKAGNSQDKMSQPEKDGADEKMLAKESDKPNEESKIALAESEYSLNDKQNGEAKLDIGDLKPAFVGMGKEELMKFANDPFWVRLRWVLFIAFWLIWLGMLVGAIIIIVTAPKCVPPKPRTWWETGPLAKVEYNEYEEIDSYIARKVKGLIVSHPTIDNSYKTFDEIKTSDTHLETFLKTAKDKNMNVILTLNPVASDQFFASSDDNNLYDFYIWADAKGTDSNGNRNLPNNWLREDDGLPAWEFSENRQKYFYAPFKNRKPCLNFRNPLVVDKFTRVIEHWLQQGIKGFYLKGVPKLLIDPNLANETMDTTKHGYTHDQYGYYKHTSHTVDVEGIGDILKQWRRAAKGGNNADENVEDDSVVFMLEEDLLSLDPYRSSDNKLQMDLPKHSIVFEKHGGVSTAKKIYDGIKGARSILENDTWPIWQYNYEKEIDREDDTGIKEPKSLPESVMNILTMLLPGSIYIDSFSNVDQELYKQRESSSFQFGSFHQQLLHNDTVYAYQRVQAGNPGILVAVNPSNEKVYVDLTSMQNLSDEVTIQLLSTNYTAYVPDYSQSGMKILAKNLTMPGKSAAILTYVPK